MNKFIFFITFVFFLIDIFVFNVYAQDDCKVLLTNLSGSYSGKCKNGFAHGKGSARGVDTYIGKFKKGLPNGYGECFYGDGKVYKGYWKNGMKHGKGILKQPCLKCTGDSIIEGIWFYDKFLKNQRKADYLIVQKRNLDRYSFSKIDEGNSIKFQFYRGSSRNNTIHDLNIYGNSGFLDNDGGYVTFKDISFPFRCKITYYTLNKTGLVEYFVTFEFEILEQGRWELKLFN